MIETAWRRRLYGIGTHSKTRDVSELKSYVKVKVAVLGILSLIVLTVSVDVKQH